jgi:two-component system, cell cycle response regulator
MDDKNSTVSLTTLKAALGNNFSLAGETPLPGDVAAEAGSLVKTLRTEAIRPISTIHQNACLVHIYPTGPEMGTRYTLGDFPLVMGRDGECGICIADQSVSRRHARIHPRTDGYYAEDLGSTNGTYVNDVAAVMVKLRDGDYLRVGSCIYRFLMGGNVETDYHAVIYKLTIVDALTDAHNKRFLLEFLERELVRSGRYHRPLSLLIFDIDHFKSINDTLGHLGGDFVLREFAARLRPMVRSDELLARYGGEEFAVVLPEATREGAAAVAERLRQIIADKPFLYEGVTIPLTVSVGVATTVGDERMTPTDLIALADQRLFDAKRQGRNCVAN